MLAKVIVQLDSEIYLKLKAEMIASRGEKMLQLMTLYRDGASEVRVAPDTLGLSKPAFYTLKSRLQDKIQKALFENALDDYGDILKNIAAIPYLISCIPRESAIMLLLYLEEELKRKDLPGEMAQVYGALKKMHSHQKNYFFYEQLYNKNVAYFLALEKAEEILTHFSRVCGYYMMSLERQHVEVMRLYLKELNNLSRINESHRINLCKYIAEISFGVFVDPNSEVPFTDDTVQDLLKRVDEILIQNPDDQRCTYIRDIFHFLNFGYYTKLGLHKNARGSFDFIRKNRESLLLRSYSCVGSNFLISAFHLYKNLDGIDAIIDALPSVDPEDEFSNFNIGLFKASVHFCSSRYAQAASILNDLLNTYSFKNFIAAECNVKLLQVLCLLMAGKNDTAEVQFRSIVRKTAALDSGIALPIGVSEWILFTKSCFSNSNGGRKEKLRKSIGELNAARSKSNALLHHLVISEDLAQLL